MKRNFHSTEEKDLFGEDSEEFGREVFVRRRKYHPC
jgi:hypothetical protein